MASYDKKTLKSDLVAALVVTIMLIPQSLAYALLAGMPLEAGLYGSILPLAIYALFGTSRTLSVGPVAVISLMTMVALRDISAQTDVQYIEACIALALLSGLFLVLMGAVNLGFIANFLSQTVVSGFISAAGILIALTQLKHLLGVDVHGENLLQLLHSLVQLAPDLNPITLGLGSGVLVFLLWSRSGLLPILEAVGLPHVNAVLFAKAAPVIGVIVTILLVFTLQLQDQNVAIIGAIPSGLPSLSWPNLPLTLFQQLWLPALGISLIGYVESVSIGKMLGARRNQRINSNQELIGLGLANIGSAVSGSLPVTGGISRSVVNYEAGAVTQAASLFAALGIALTALYFSPFLFYLPKATLAATIIVAVIGLLDFSILRKTWSYSKSDFMAVLTTISGTLLLGVEMGVAMGVLISVLLHLYRTSVPHIAEVGLVEGTHQFRNVKRLQVLSNSSVLSLRVDEGLYFANASYLEELINTRLNQNKDIRHVILLGSAISEIDYTAIHALMAINRSLEERGVTFHLSEIKGIVMDRVRRSGLLEELTGKVYLSHYHAFTELTDKVPLTASSPVASHARGRSAV